VWPNRAATTPVNGARTGANVSVVPVTSSLGAALNESATCWGIATVAISWPWNTWSPTSTRVAMTRPGLSEPTCTRSPVTWAFSVMTKYVESYQ